MKKIVAAFDGLKFSASTRDYAIQVAKQSSAHLVGIFLEDFSYHSYKVYDLIREEGEHFEEKQKRLDKKDDKLRADAANDFESACQKAGIEFTLHHDRSIALQELLHESIYADLLIIDNSETLTHYTEKIPTRFIRDLLTDVQCPVLLVPHKFKSIDKLVLLYDGEPASVYAIKMFSYTLAALKQYPEEVISVNPPKQSLHLPDNKLMKEFMKRHFPRAVYKVLKGLPETEIVDYLKEQGGNPLVILGAYRRGTVSRWFRASMADVLMKDLKLPLFIAHNK
ncbi:MAG: universal stress protein [Chitinophagaceae bacterium]|nr:universal stress protein [Chitinophagaceae bacterium]